MDRRRQLIVGLTLLVAGLVVIAIGTIFPSSNSVLALGWLLLFPLLVSFAGTLFVFVGLVRRLKGVPRKPEAHIIVGLSAVAGLGLGLGFGAAGIVSQVPDSIAGLNGSFVPGSAPGLGAFVCGGVGLSVGLVIGAIATLIWSSMRRRPSARV